MSFPWPAQLRFGVHRFDSHLPHQPTTRLRSPHAVPLQPGSHSSTPVKRTRVYCRSINPSGQIFLLSSTGS